VSGTTVRPQQDPPRGLTVLGSAAGCGKTGVSIGVLRHLRLRGVACSPFKAVAVVAPDDPAYAAAEPWQRGVLHNCTAAGVPVRWWNNPVVVVLPHMRATVGDLYVRGERAGSVPIAGEDSLDAARLPVSLRRICEEGIEDGFKVLEATGDWLLVEGAGATGEVSPEDDLANQILPARARLPVALVTNPLRSGHVAALAGLPSLLTPAVRALLIGYVLNQVGGTPRADLLAPRLTAVTGLPMLGAIADSPLPEGYDGSASMLTELYERRRRYVAQSGLLDRLPVPPGSASTTPPGTVA
jgi:dethiobiotin synthetase